MQLISKLPKIGTTIFTTMSKMAMEHNAINLAQGFPNFPVNERLLELTQETIRENSHQYAPMAGHPLLLDQLALLTNNSYGRVVDPNSEILVTAGATQAIFTTIQALIHTSDEVVILDPSYDCYAPAVSLSGGIPVHVSLTDSFLPDWSEIRAKCNSRTRMILINNPHNPSGRIFQESDIKSLENVLESFPKIILLSDEVYEYITFEQKHISVNTREKLLNRAVIISSVGKTFHITGWKIGYLIAPEFIMKEIKKVHQYLVFSVNSVAQITLSKYLKEVDVMQLGAYYQQKRNLFSDLIKESRFILLPSEGSYFQTVSFAPISDKNDVLFCEDLIKNYGVAAIPLSVFNESKKDNKVIRFCFAKDQQTLELAAKKLCRI